MVAVRLVRPTLLCLAALAACSSTSEVKDAGETRPDAALADAATADVGGGDATVRDGGAPDGAEPDAASAHDAGLELPALPAVTGEGTFEIPGRTEGAIQVVVPASRGAHPPLVLAFHGTGGEPSDAVVDFDLEAEAEALGFVAIAPRAGYRDAPHPADVDHMADGGGSSWVMWSATPEANEDLRYVLALIDAAEASWGADRTRVYTLGFSNGAFFAYFAAAALPDRVAGFAENSGGWTNAACPTRYDPVSEESSYLLGTDAPAGQDVPCAEIFLDPEFPTACRVSAASPLSPPHLAGRVPFGLLGHYTKDDVVSVVWSCVLAEGLGGRARTRIRASEEDGLTGHVPIPGFVGEAWSFFAGRSVAE